MIPTADSSGSGSGVTEPAVAPTAPQAPSKSNTALIIGVCAGLFVLVLLVVAGGIMYFRRRMKSAQFDITFTQVGSLHARVPWAAARCGRPPLGGRG